MNGRLTNVIVLLVFPFFPNDRDFSMCLSKIGDKQTDAHDESLPGGPKGGVPGWWFLLRCSGFHCERSGAMRYLNIQSLF